MSQEITKEPLTSIQGTIDAALEEGGELADWLRRASEFGMELVVRRSDEEYVLDLSKLKP